MNFSEKDIQQIKQKGLTIDKINAQLDLFVNGVPFINLDSAATIGNGIILLTNSEKEQYVNLFDSRRNSISIVKFVPASGAATRMFKMLITFLKEYDPKKESINSYINRNKAIELSMFLVGLERLPIFEEVVHKVHEVISNFNELSYDEKRVIADRCFVIHILKNN